MEVGTDGEMSPRLEMASAPYAINSSKLDALSSVVNIDSTKKQLAINTTASELGASAASLIVSAPHGSDTTQNAIMIMNDTLPKTLLGHVGGISKRANGALALYGYIGGSANTAQFAPITFHRNGADEGEVMRIHSNGKVGIGTTDPKRPLHVAGNSYFMGDISIGPSYGAENNWGFVGEAGHLTWSSDKYLHLSSNAPNGYGLVLGPNDDYAHQITIMTNGNVGVGTHNPSYPLHMASGAYVTTGGVWTNASSRELKQDIKDLSLDAALSTLKQMNPVTFAYKNEPEGKHVGFIAEDVPELVATKDRKGLSPMDTLAVVTKVVQDQQKTIKAQQETINELKSMLKQTLAGVSSIQKQVNHLETNQGQPVLCWFSVNVTNSLCG